MTKRKLTESEFCHNAGGSYSGVLPCTGNGDVPLMFHLNESVQTAVIR